MAESPRVQLRQDTLVDRLMPEPGGPINFITLNGLLGKSPLPEYDWRVYSRDFGSYIDIKEADILHAQQLDPEDPSGGNTTLYVRAPAMSGLNDFLQGPMGMLAMARPMVPDNRIGLNRNPFTPIFFGSWICSIWGGPWCPH